VSPAGYGVVVSLGAADGVSLGVGVGAGSADGGSVGVGPGVEGLDAEGLGAAVAVGLGAVGVGVGTGVTGVGDAAATAAGCGVRVPAGPACRPAGALGDPVRAGAARRSSRTAGEEEPAAGEGTVGVEAETLAKPGSGRTPACSVALTDADATASVPYRARAIPPTVPKAPVSVSVSTSAYRPGRRCVAGSIRRWAAGRRWAGTARLQSECADGEWDLPVPPCRYDQPRPRPRSVMVSWLTTNREETA
jgi:hypothetical protein